MSRCFEVHILASTKSTAITRFSHFLWSFISSRVAELAGAFLLLKNELLIWPLLQFLPSLE